MLNINRKFYRIIAFTLIMSVVLFATDHIQYSIDNKKDDASQQDSNSYVATKNNIDLTNLEKYGIKIGTSSSAGDNTQFELYNPKQFDLRTIADTHFGLMRDYQITKIFEPIELCSELACEFNLKSNVILQC